MEPIFKWRVGKDHWMFIYPAPDGLYITWKNSTESEQPVPPPYLPMRPPIRRPLLPPVRPPPPPVRPLSPSSVQPSPPPPVQPPPPPVLEKETAGEDETYASKYPNPPKIKYRPRPNIKYAKNLPEFIDEEIRLIMYVLEVNGAAGITKPELKKVLRWLTGGIMELDDANFTHRLERKLAVEGIVRKFYDAERKPRFRLTKYEPEQAP